MLTPFELVYVCAEPTLPAIYAIVRRRLRRALRGVGDGRPNLLDVGGRKSHYTIGLPARVTVTDLPRRSALQERMNLGVSEGMVRQLRARRIVSLLSASSATSSSDAVPEKPSSGSTRDSM